MGELGAVGGDDLRTGLGGAQLQARAVRQVQPPAEALRAVGRAQLRAEVHTGRKRRDEMVGVRRGLGEERLVLARGAGGVAHADRPDRDVDVVERDALVRAVAHFERDDRGERREAAAALPQAQVHRGRRAVGAERAHRQLALHHDVRLARPRDPRRAGAEPRVDAFAGLQVQRLVTAAVELGEVRLRELDRFAAREVGVRVA